MVARVVTLTYEDGRWFAEARQWLEGPVSGAAQIPGLLGGYWMVNRWDAKVAAITIFESEDALRADEERLTRLLGEAAERFPPLTQTVEEFVVVQSWHER